MLVIIFVLQKQKALIHWMFKVIFAKRMTLCTLRNWFKRDDAWHGVVGGFFTGLPLFIEKPYRRPELVQFSMKSMKLELKMSPSLVFVLYMI